MVSSETIRDDALCDIDLAIDRLIGVNDCVHEIHLQKVESAALKAYAYIVRRRAEIEQEEGWERQEAEEEALRAEAGLD